MYARCSSCEVPSFIVRNFSAVNGRWFMPRRVWRKNTGPGDSREIRQAA